MGRFLHMSEDELSGQLFGAHAAAPVRITVRALAWTWAIAGQLDTHAVALFATQECPGVPRAAEVSLA